MSRRKRRTPEQMIEDLQAEITRIQESAKAKSSPAHKQAKAALRALGKAHDLAREEGEADLERDLARAIDALEGSTGSQPASSPRVRRSAEDVAALSLAIWDALKDRPELSISEIAEAVDSTPKEVRGPLVKLVEDGRARKEGERRGTKYFAKGKRPRE